jgi:hypothetical protein
MTSTSTHSLTMREPCQVVDLQLHSVSFTEGRLCRQGNDMRPGDQLTSKPNTPQDQAMLPYIPYLSNHDG